MTLNASNSYMLKLSFQDKGTERSKIDDYTSQNFQG